MNDLLPDVVIRALGEQYKRAVGDAVDSYPEQRGDEDSVTGALGLSMKQTVTGKVVVGGTTWQWRTTSRKLRGRGKNAPEKRLGADAALELEVWDGAGVRGRKSLLIQSKNDWTSRDPKLWGQASKLAALPGSGLVVDYKETGFTAVDARIAADAGGSRKRIDPERFRDLGSYLADEFLGCRVGSRSTYYDAERELLIVLDSTGKAVGEIVSLDHRVLTQVQFI